MNVIQFDSPEEMRRHMAASAHAHSHEHIAQESIGYGDTWVQFADLSTTPRRIVFGRVATLDEVMNRAVVAGSTRPEAEQVCRNTDSMLSEGFLYGKAYDYLCPTGEYGHTHKTHAWPIDRDCFYDARDVAWLIDDMSLAQRLNLSIAFQAWRSHVRSGH